MKLRARLYVEGREHIPEGPFIIVSNHVSNWDPVALGIAFSARQVRALGKQELFELPILGRIAYWTGGIPIRRGEADREALSRCKAALRAGDPLIILPEGTRSRTGALNEGKLGIVAMAQMTNVPVLPAAVTGTRAMGWPWRRATVLVRFGPAFSIPRSERRPEQRQAALNHTMTAIARLLPPALRGVYGDQDRD
ncbi:MAG: 1-acyl-sn-glycerol-3-phosphate acyltransferase [Herpetosiphonaceae bacterium]|nr:1-acyl-sn-glycerol-3-phosphate acyltransferase [Herpetosiphonaceae bacterium]